MNKSELEGEGGRERGGERERQIDTSGWTAYFTEEEIPVFEYIGVDSALIQHPIKQRPGRDHRTSTAQEMLEGINITERESCRSVTG